MLPYNARKNIALAIPIFTAALLFGFIEGVFNLKIDENIASSGVTLAVVFGVLNVYLAWALWKNRT